jgi:hypothetical protein
VPAVSATAADRDIRLPGTTVTIHERDGDPVRLTSYSLDNPTRVYLRAGNGGFAVRRGYTEATVSPGGARAALRSDTFTRDDYDSVEILNRSSGEKTEIKTVKKPAEAYEFYWSRDGRKIIGLLDKASKTNKKVAGGFVTVDVTTGRRRVVSLAGLPKDASFRWTPDGRQVVGDHASGKKEGVRFYNPDGTVVRTLDRVGTPISGEDMFSPSGKLFVTWCPLKINANLCLWDTRTGRGRGTVARNTEEDWGWWDESHLYSVIKKRGAYQLVVLDLKGRVVRLLADIPSSAWSKSKQNVYLSYTR